GPTTTQRRGCSGGGPGSERTTAPLGACVGSSRSVGRRRTRRRCSCSSSSLSPTATTLRSSGSSSSFSRTTTTLRCGGGCRSGFGRTPTTLGRRFSSLYYGSRFGFQFFRSSIGLGLFFTSLGFHFNAIRFSTSFTPFSGKGCNGFGQIGFCFGRQFGFKRSNSFLGFGRYGFRLGFNLCRFSGYFCRAHSRFQRLQLFFFCI